MTIRQPIRLRVNITTGHRASPWKRFLLGAAGVRAPLAVLALLFDRVWRRR
jgi:hypothetical protein